MGKLGKIPPGVGPKHPQVIVLVGATGDLSRRKLLPGLFHLSSAGFIPGCQIIGVSLDNIEADGFSETLGCLGAKSILEKREGKSPAMSNRRR
jgi:glucose-6-phosphate 1-dehydrogenase